ncbi:3-dehydroquinate synthase [Rubrobacter xylanophilus]|uniref:3-dehydroquinate synthase n=1 Tax=Rubrobacter xylanophilus TaxID=49319 RepID=A0A510HKN6_9ACTN|nr:3-dehydroquinate synthase [Rubrobacter xylanophilus]BBL78917.1 3-dehydroquinate synthase [Rubrobacter xylanophilus]
MAARLEVRAGTAYPVEVGFGLDVGELAAAVLEPGECALLTDSTVGPLYAEKVRRSLRGVGWRLLETVEVPAGEGSKSLAVYGDVLRRLARAGLMRDGVLFALGGGVVGDLGGFVAASYMRGIPLVMLPTTLLAMVDSSVGGKAGLDLPEGKNLVGAFLQPRIVIAELGFLESLSGRELSRGLAEVVKMGLLAGGEFFGALERVGAALRREAAALEELVLRSVSFKAAVVAEDERERGRRAILNYGHTVGHGLEAASGYALAHGEAVAVGMVAEALLARRVLGSELVGLHERLLREARLPVRAPGLDAHRVLGAMGRDKKRRGGAHRFVLLEGVGRPVWGVEVGEEEARRAVEAVLG